MQLVDVEGLELGSCVLRALRLGLGDWVEVRLPGSCRGPEWKALIAFLRRATPDSVSCVKIAARVAEPASLLRRRFPWLRDVRLGELRKDCAQELLSDWDALAVDYGWRDRDPCSVLPGNPRKLIMILLAMSASRLVVFDTAGNDPRGAERVEDFVGRARSRGWAFVQAEAGRGFSSCEVRQR